MLLQRCIVVTGLLVLCCCCQVESKRRHHSKKIDSFGSMSDKLDEQFREGQKFMKHQVNPSHKNRGWKHGRDEDSKELRSSYSSFEKESATDTQGEYEKRFKEFVKTHGCEDGPVYKKFLQYYRIATANLKKKQVGSKFETSWLQQLANNSSVGSCSNSCPGSWNTSERSSSVPKSDIESNYPDMVQPKQKQNNNDAVGNSNAEPENKSNDGDIIGRQKNYQNTDRNDATPPKNKDGDDIESAGGPKKYQSNRGIDDNPSIKPIDTEKFRPSNASISAKKKTIKAAASSKSAVSTKSVLKIGNVSNPPSSEINPDPPNGGFSKNIAQVKATSGHSNPKGDHDIRPADTEDANPIMATISPAEP